MRLETHNGILSDSPTDEQIWDALASVNDADNEMVYAILTRSDKPAAYIVASGGPKSYSVEYHEQDKDYAAEGDVPYELVAFLFTSYNRGDDAWRAKVRWQEVTLPPAGARWAAPALVLVLVLLVVVAVLLYKMAQ